MYVGDSLKKWGGHSNLLAVIRTLHQEFELCAPIPVGHADLRRGTSVEPVIDKDE